MKKQQWTRKKQTAKDNRRKAEKQKAKIKLVKVHKLTPKKHRVELEITGEVPRLNSWGELFSFLKRLWKDLPKGPLDEEVR